MPNITTTNIDLGGVALEVWHVIEGALKNVEVTDQNYAEGTILSRDTSDGKLVPYAPAAGPDAVVDVAAVDVANVPTLEAIDHAVVVPGALVGDIVDIEPLGTWPVGLSLPQGRVLVDGTVQVRVVNVTAADINPGAQIMRFSLRHAANALKPKFVLTYPVTGPASSDTRVTVLAAGKVDQGRLVIHNATALTDTMLDDLMDRAIFPVSRKQLSMVDNPQ